MRRSLGFEITSVAIAITTMTTFIAYGQFAGPRKVASAEYTALAAVPDAARLRANPLTNDLRAIAAGRKLFGRHCAQCHGKNAEGTDRAPSLLEDEVQQAPPGALFWVLTNGVVRRGMPVWSKLPEAQRWQIASYVQTLKTPRHPGTSNSTTGVEQAQ